MPIKQLRQRIETEPTHGMILLGMLHKGAQKPERGPGRELPYFRVTFPDQTPAQQKLAEQSLRPAWLKLYGDQPLVITGLQLIDDDPDLAFTTWYEEQGNEGRLNRRCDGHGIQLFRGENGLLEKPWRFLACQQPSCQCKQHGRLRFYLPEFTQLTGIMGYFQISTHSYNDCLHILGFLTKLSKWAGGLQGIPIEMSREPQEVTVKMNGKDGKLREQAMTKYMVRLKVSPAFMPVLAQLVKQRPALAAQVTIEEKSAIPETIDDPGTVAEPEPEQPPEPDHWSQDPPRWQYFIKWTDARNLDRDFLPKPITEYETVREACEALMSLSIGGAEHSESPRSEAQNVDSAQTSESFEEAKARIDAKLNHTEESRDQGEVAGEGLSVVDLGRLCDQFNLPIKDVWDELGVQSWIDFGTVEQAKARILGYASEHNWPVFDQKVIYQKLPKQHMRFSTVLGTLHWFKGRNELVDALAEIGYEGDDYEKIRNWKEGEHRLPENVLLHWKADPKSGRLDVISFEPI